MSIKIKSTNDLYELGMMLLNRTIENKNDRSQKISETGLYKALVKGVSDHMRYVNEAAEIQATDTLPNIKIEDE